MNSVRSQVRPRRKEYVFSLSILREAFAECGNLIHNYWDLLTDELEEELQDE